MVLEVKKAEDRSFIEDRPGRNKGSKLITEASKSRFIHTPQEKEGHK